MDFGLVIGIVGFLAGLYFGLRSLFQQSDLEALQRALRAYNQGVFNNLWRIGASGDSLLEATDFNQAKQLARGIGDMSHTARHWVVAFSKEHARFTPSYEPAWEPREPPPVKERPGWRAFFLIS